MRLLVYIVCVDDPRSFPAHQGEVVMKTACGTPGYVAPEVLTHEIYSEQV